MQMAAPILNIDTFQYQVFCRLCGTKDTISMIEFTDTYSFMGETTGILDLLKKTTLICHFEEEFEKFMPHCICVTCFNMAVDFQVFLDSAMNNQKKILDQILFYNKHSKLEERERDFKNDSETHAGSLVDAKEILIKVENIDHHKLQNLPETQKLSSNENTVHEIKYNLPFTLNDKKPKNRKKETIIEIKNRLKAHIQNFPNITGLNTKLSTPISDNDDKGEFVGIIKNKDKITSNDCHQAKNEKSPKKSISCPQCNRMFNRQNELKSHIISHSNNRPYKCSKCSMSFKYQRNLKEHISIHSENPEYICAICGMTFRQRSNLLKHEKSHDDFEKKRYICFICKKTFSQSSHLSTHTINVHHNSNKKYSCNKCDSTLKCMSSLRRHISTVHANCSKYFCSDCNKGFNSLQNYQGHIRSHTGERPYSCNSCDKSFTTTKALSRHRLTHQGIKTHKCPQCEKAFLESGDLKRHMKRHIKRKNKLKNKSQLKSFNINNTSIDNVQCLATSTTSVVATPVVSRIESVNLMMLTEPLIITEAQQILGTANNPQTHPVLANSDKIDPNRNSNHVTIMENDILKTASHNSEPINNSTPVINVSQATIEVQKPVSSPQQITNVISPADINSRQLLESVTLVHESSIDHSSCTMNQLSAPRDDLAVITSSAADATTSCETSITVVHPNVVHTSSQCVSGSLETHTMFTLSSVRASAEYVPMATDQYNGPEDIIGTTNTQQNERVLSQAGW